VLCLVPPSVEFLAHVIALAAHVRDLIPQVRHQDIHCLLPHRRDHGVHRYCVSLRRIARRNGRVYAELAGLDSPLPELIARGADAPAFDGAENAALVHAGRRRGVCER
jgi:hypothetical protein